MACIPVIRKGQKGLFYIENFYNSIIKEELPKIKFEKSIPKGKKVYNTSSSILDEKLSNADLSLVTKRKLAEYIILDSKVIDEMYNQNYVKNRYNTKVNPHIAYKVPKQYLEKLKSFSNIGLNNYTWDEAYFLDGECTDGARNYPKYHIYSDSTLSDKYVDTFNLLKNTLSTHKFILDTDLLTQAVSIQNNDLDDDMYKDLIEMLKTTNKKDKQMAFSIIGNCDYERSKWYLFLLLAEYPGKLGRSAQMKGFRKMFGITNNEYLWNKGEWISYILKNHNPDQKAKQLIADYIKNHWSEITDADWSTYAKWDRYNGYYTHIDNDSIEGVEIKANVSVEVNIK